LDGHQEFHQQQPPGTTPRHTDELSNAAPLFGNQRSEYSVNTCSLRWPYTLDELAVFEVVKRGGN
jgi:hypothetical protein